MIAENEVARRAVKSILKMVNGCCLLFAQLGERSCPAWLADPGKTNSPFGSAQSSLPELSQARQLNVSWDLLPRQSMWCWNWMKENEWMRSEVTVTAMKGGCVVPCSWRCAFLAMYAIPKSEATVVHTFLPCTPYIRLSHLVLGSKSYGNFDLYKTRIVGRMFGHVTSFWWSF